MTQYNAQLETTQTFSLIHYVHYFGDDGHQTKAKLKSMLTYAFTSSALILHEAYYLLVIPGKLIENIHQFHPSSVVRVQSSVSVSGHRTFSSFWCASYQNKTQLMLRKHRMHEIPTNTESRPQLGPRVRTTCPLLPTVTVFRNKTVDAKARYPASTIAKMSKVMLR